MLTMTFGLLRVRLLRPCRSRTARAASSRSWPRCSSRTGFEETDLARLRPDRGRCPSRRPEVLARYPRAASSTPAPDAGEGVLETCPEDQGMATARRHVDACEAAGLSKESPPGARSGRSRPTIEDFGRGACSVAMIANTWTRPIHLNAELVSSEPLDISKSTFIGRSKNGKETTHSR